MEQHKDLQGDQLAKEVDKQSWDPSVKALTQFPAVLANMNQNLAWTSELGDAHLNQQQELTQAIQTMRQRAKQAGNLKTTPQEKVSTKGQTIVIQPAAPDVVYVPRIRSLAGVWSTACRLPRLVSVSGTFPGRAGNRFWTGFRGWTHLPASAGVGTVGDSIGTAAGESNTTTIRSSRIAGPSSIAIVLIRHRANFNHAADSHGRSFGGHGDFSCSVTGRNAFRRLQWVQPWRGCESQFLPRTVQLWRLPWRRLGGGASMAEAGPRRRRAGDSSHEVIKP